MPIGALYAALAFALWGIFPLYFRQIATVPSGEILVHRIVWSLVFVLVVLALRRQWAWVKPVLRSPKVLLAFVASAVLLSANWLVYIWAVNNGHVIDASLGYFINPLVNVLLGYTVLHERLRRAQWVALGIAAAGVLWLTILAGHLPWIALALAASFGAYGLLRKVASLGALEGLTLETLLLAPIALAVLGLWMGQGTSVFPAPDASTNFWLIAAGPITAIPLLLFAAGARQISLTTLGLLQYIGPTIQLALGLWLFHEPFSAERLMGFALIWLALALYSAEGWWRSRTTPAPQTA
ncbi:EamA family transporter RarD [Rhizobacter sp. J219]|jgi:chloramphenicol-sensitive protein RarD|uniref:EamA family transporter RarD n=1 Tax=Rhizobacter sp. J219 TaxID=2898430 RepID=UPI0021514749|nr:EamA family transporter RarD [Rhizobacter sp. J219]MCR5886083.1 EamA family transporter RarD [Rhizobacter sp. J219]